MNNFHYTVYLLSHKVLFGKQTEHVIVIAPNKLPLDSLSLIGSDPDFHTTFKRLALK